MELTRDVALQSAMVFRGTVVCDESALHRIPLDMLEALGELVGVHYLKMELRPLSGRAWKGNGVALHHGCSGFDGWFVYVNDDSPTGKTMYTWDGARWRS